MAASHEWPGHPACCVTIAEDASLMSSNLTVLHQYTIVLHRMSTEVLHCVFGQGFFPFDAAPVPHMLRAATQMAAMGLWPGWSRWIRFGYCSRGLGVPGLPLLSPVAVRLIVGPVQPDCLPAPLYSVTCDRELCCTHISYGTSS